MAELATCLMFQSDAEEAARLYTSIVPGSAITGVRRTTPDSPVLLVDFTLGGAVYAALNMNMPVQHEQSASIVVMTADQAECDRIWQAHLDAGGTAVACGWLRDRYGVSWQIWPKQLIELTFGGTPEQNSRATAAMVSQIKIDLAAVQAAYDGADA